MTPSRDAMGFIYSNEAYICFFQDVDELIIEKGFGGKVEELQFSLFDFCVDLFLLCCRKRGIEEDCICNSFFSQGIYLVLHEGDEWRDHERKTLEDDSGYLKAERFASSCRHDCKGVFSLQDIVDDCFLIGAEVLVAEYFSEHLKRDAWLIHYLEKRGLFKKIGDSVGSVENPLQLFYFSYSF